jgi:hypothetical protein
LFSDEFEIHHIIFNVRYCKCVHLGSNSVQTSCTANGMNLSIRRISTMLLFIKRTVKVKLKRSLCLIKPHAMKPYNELNQIPGRDVWGNGNIAPRIPSAALDGSGSSASSLSPFTPGTHCIAGWEGRRVGLDAVTKRKDPSSPLPGTISGT